MDISSSKLKELWSDHHRNIKRYGLFALMLLAGLKSADYVSTWIGLAGMLCIYAYDHWGVYWEEAGKQILFPNKIQKEQAERARRAANEAGATKQGQ